MPIVNVARLPCCLQTQRQQPPRCYHDSRPTSRLRTLNLVTGFVIGRRVVSKRSRLGRALIGCGALSSSCYCGDQTSLKISNIRSIASLPATQQSRTRRSCNLDLTCQLPEHLILPVWKSSHLYLTCAYFTAHSNTRSATPRPRAVVRPIVRIQHSFTCTT